MSAIFSRRVSYLGRNGICHATGLAFSSFGLPPVPKTVVIEPINSKGQVGRCVIEIPAEDVPKVIAQLMIQSSLIYTATSVNTPKT